MYIRHRVIDINNMFLNVSNYNNNNATVLVSGIILINEKINERKKTSNL